MQLIKMFFYLVVLFVIFQDGYSDDIIFFQVNGNVYPDGYYYVIVNLGDPPIPYQLDFDTGSHLTWIQCDAPCQKCLPAPNPPYRPVTRVLVLCTDPRCEDVRYPPQHQCMPNEQCDYYVKYVDGGSSFGVLISDPFPMQYPNRTITNPNLAFGCGYRQSHPDPSNRPHVDGIIGLDSGKEGILSQLTDLGIIRNVVGHCLSSKGGGYLFLGDGFVPSGIVWTPIVSKPELAKRYYLGMAELYVGGFTSQVKDLRVVFDSATTYTYFVPEAYNALVFMLKAELHGQRMELNSRDEDLPVCWKGTRPFQSIEDVKDLFKPVVLRFENAQNTWYEMDPEAYLIITKRGRACLGILNSESIGVPDINLIGDISFHDKFVIYDNENQRIGWANSDCKDHPQLD